MQYSLKIQYQRSQYINEATPFICFIAMTEKIIIAAAISILTFLALAVILVVDSTDDVFRPIGLLLLCLVGASIILAKVEPRCRSTFLWRNQGINAFRFCWGWVACGVALLGVFAK